MTEDKIKELAEVVGAIQDTLRVNSDAIKGLAGQLYAQVISLDLVFMELVSFLPEDERKGILQNQFDESLSGAENDLKGLLRSRNYVNRRIRDCKKFIESRKGENEE